MAMLSLLLKIRKQYKHYIHIHPAISEQIMCCQAMSPSSRHISIESSSCKNKFEDKFSFKVFIIHAIYFQFVIQFCYTIHTFDLLLTVDQVNDPSSWEVQHSTSDGHLISINKILSTQPENK